MISPSSSHDPIVVFVGAAASAHLEIAQLELTCRFYGLHLVRAFEASQEGSRIAGEIESTPILVILSGSALMGISAARRKELLAWAESYGSPIAVIGISSGCDSEVLRPFASGAEVRAINANPASNLWSCAIDPTATGFELRGVPLRLTSGAASALECSGEPTLQVLASVGLNQQTALPALVRICRDGRIRYLASSITPAGADAGAPWHFHPARFGEVASLFLLLRDAGGARCWQPPDAVANLTIDDPWLTEPYGSLSYSGLLAEMKRERFHSTIGFVPWNYDRNSAEAVTVVKSNPDSFTIAVHGNNHDRYEFYRYESQPGDNQRPKPLPVQAFNIRQALARMEIFRKKTKLEFDRVMVFPHGVCPAPTFEVLKQNGFWATSNYSNVPLGETPPADAATALRAVNAEWDDFPALRRNYPQNLSEEAIAVDLFLGNPVMFMAHQDLFFSGIDAFTPYARRVNLRQPAVKWLGLGEVSRRVHLLRWPEQSRCEVRMFSRHARVHNSRLGPAKFQFTKRESGRLTVARVTIDGVETRWSFISGEVRFEARLAAGAEQLIEIHYSLPEDRSPIEIQRSGIRNRTLRWITDVRDLVLPRSLVGQLLTRKYYQQGKHRPTLRTLLLGRFARPNRPDTSHPKS